MRNIREPDNEQACWFWQRKCDRLAYGQINVYVPGLGRAYTFKTHALAWVLIWSDSETVECADDAYLAYKTLTQSGLQLDHLCVMPPCLNPAHLELVTGRENSARRRKPNREAHGHPSLY
jgi:hypothetical protein